MEFICIFSFSFCGCGFRYGITQGLSSNIARLAREKKVVNGYFHVQYLPLVLLAVRGWSGLNPSTTAVCCVREIFRWHNNNIWYAWSVRFLLNSGRLTAESLFTLQLPQREESLRSYANLTIITCDFLTSTLTGCTRASSPGLLGNLTLSLSSAQKCFLWWGVRSPKLTLMLSLFQSSSKPWFDLTAQNLLYRPDQLVFWSISIMRV